MLFFSYRSFLLFFLGPTKDDLSYLFKYSTHPGSRREKAVIFVAAIPFKIFRNETVNLKSHLKILFWNARRRLLIHMSG